MVLDCIYSSSLLISEATPLHACYMISAVYKRPYVEKICFIFVGPTITMQNSYIVYHMYFMSEISIQLLHTVLYNSQNYHPRGAENDPVYCYLNLFGRGCT